MTDGCANLIDRGAEVNPCLLEHGPRQNPEAQVSPTCSYSTSPSPVDQSGTVLELVAQVNGTGMTGDSAVSLAARSDELHAPGGEICASDGEIENRIAEATAVETAKDQSADHTLGLHLGLPKQSTITVPAMKQESIMVGADGPTVRCSACPVDEISFTTEDVGPFASSLADVMPGVSADVLDEVLEHRTPVISVTTLPVRLRMLSTDKLCARSMTVEWEDSSGCRQKWVSSDDPLQNGWYESEKLLQPCSRDISVQFAVKGPRKGWSVCMVDRHKRCSWVQTNDGKYIPEMIHLRSGPGQATDPIDAVFELKGPVHKCFVSRAWNAARIGSPDKWERWDDEESRPPSEGPPAVLLAAEGVGLPRNSGDAESCLQTSSARLNAAIVVLLDIHRETLWALRGLDMACTGQWYRANAGTTACAGLMIVAVPMTFVLPPVGLGLAIVSGVASGAAWGGDTLQERWSLTQLRKQLSRDSWNAFVVAELLREWLHARVAAGKAMGQSPLDGMGADNRNAPSRAMAAAKSATFTIAMFGDDVVKFLPVLGPAGLIIGAVLTTGMAIHGWATQKFSQKEVRAKMAELRVRLLLLQYLVTTLGTANCPLCSAPIEEEDHVKYCSDLLHCCHMTCLESLSGPAGKDSARCPTCTSQLDPRSGTVEECAMEEAAASSKEPNNMGMRLGSMRRSLSTLTSHLTPATRAAARGSDTANVPHDDSPLWEMVGQLDAVAEVLSSPALSWEQAMQVAMQLEECEAGRENLETLVAETYHRPDQAELAIEIACTLDRLQEMLIEHSTWAVAAPSCSSDTACAMPSSGDALSMPAFNPAPRAGKLEGASLTTPATSSQSTGSLAQATSKVGQRFAGMRSIVSSSATKVSASASAAVASASASAAVVAASASNTSGRVGQKSSGIREAASQRVSVVGDELSTKASAAVVELKEKTFGARGVASSMTSAVVRE